MTRGADAIALQAAMLDGWSGLIAQVAPLRADAPGLADEASALLRGRIRVAVGCAPEAWAGDADALVRLVRTLRQIAEMDPPADEVLRGLREPRYGGWVAPGDPPLPSYGRGRPPHGPEAIRSDVLRIRVSADERAAIEGAAGDEGVSTWLRELALRAAATRRSGAPTA